MEMNKLHSAYRQLQIDCKRFWLPAVCALLYLMVSEYFFHTPCPVAILFHFPCPGCGMTRACMALLKGNPAGAFQYHAMIYFWIPLALYFGIFRYFFQKEPPLFLQISIGMGFFTMVYYAFRLVSGSAFALIS